MIKIAFPVPFSPDRFLSRWGKPSAPESTKMINVWHSDVCIYIYIYKEN